MVLEGMVPVLTQTPPTTDRASTTATLFFILAAATAARCPEGPEPMTVRSYLTALMRDSPQKGSMRCGGGGAVGNKQEKQAALRKNRSTTIGLAGWGRTCAWIPGFESDSGWVRK